MTSPMKVKWMIVLAVAVFIGYLCLLVLLPFLSVIAWSSVLVIAFHPMHAWLVRKTRRVALSALIASVAVVMVILVPLLFITGLAINQFMALRGYAQEALEHGITLPASGPMAEAAEWLARRGLDGQLVLDWMARHGSEFGAAAAGYSLTLAANISSLVLSIAFTIFAMFLLFRDGGRMVADIPGLLPFPRAQSEAMLARIVDAIYASVYGVLVIAAIQGALCGAMFWLLGIPSAALWGVATALTSVLPVVGAAAVWVPGVIYLAVTGHWILAIVLGAWGTLVVSAVDNFLRPKLVGGRIGLSEVVTFFALLGGLQVFGILGIILGPVLFAVAASIFEALKDDVPVSPEAETRSQGV